KKIYRFEKSMLVCKSFALVMRVNFPAAVALWLHFSSSATVCAPPSALTARSALLRSPPRAALILALASPHTPLPSPRRALASNTVENSSHRDPTRGTLSGEPPPTPRTPRNARSWPRTRATTRRRENFSRLLPAFERGVSERVSERASERAHPTVHDFRLSLSDAVYE
ncbi:hypothetical protein ALC62_09717, partial [Cyphomyrmex costatus]